MGNNDKIPIFAIQKPVIMFNPKKNAPFMTKGQDIDQVSINLIGTGTIITGEVKANGDLRIDGTVSGSIQSKGKVVVGPTGAVEGEITCQNADVSGTVKGNMFVAELLALKSSANLKGEIVTNKLSIEPGANFSGSCSMGGVVKDLKHAEARDKKAEKTA
jgi:cytoskeletal protein CcmA (bactofilin family)